jgi:hypothetical protein
LKLENALTSAAHYLIYRFQSTAGVSRPRNRRATSRALQEEVATYLRWNAEMIEPDDPGTAKGCRAAADLVDALLLGR